LTLQAELLLAINHLFHQLDNSVIFLFHSVHVIQPALLLRLVFRDFRMLKKLPAILL
jgi:hypothetical protein